MNRNWYVIHCEPRCDQRVTAHAASLPAEVFAPRIPRTRRRNGEKPLFPGYVFVRLDPADSTLGRIRFMPGVRSIVEAGGAPCPVDDEIVEEIRSRIEALSRPRQRQPGDRVAIASGPFADLEGIFCETLSDQERVAVLLTLMRRQVRVILSAQAIESADDGAAA